MSALTKSYVNAADAQNPIDEDLVMSKRIQSALAKGHDGELIFLDSKERISTTDLLAKADRYAKSLIALGMIPGEDHVAVVGGVSVEIVSMYAATSLIGVGYAHPFIFHPMETCLTNVLPLVQSKIVIVGEGHGGDYVPVVSSLFDPDKDMPASDQLPFVQHIFYDKTCAVNSRQTINCIKSLDDLLEFGTNVSDEKLREYKLNVKPDYIMHHLFTSGSTGKPKCVAHTQGRMANDTLQVKVHLKSVMAMHINVDELLSYAPISLLLCGQISKLILIHDYKDDFDMQGAANECAEAIVSEKVEHLVLPGTFLSVIANYFEAKSDRPEFSALNIKTMIHGGQLVSKGFKERNERVLGGMAYTIYGTSEVLITAWTPTGSSDKDRKKRMEGEYFAKPNTELRIVNENNEVVDIGVDGEIQVKSYSKLKEYRYQEDKTRELYTEDGFIKTGYVNKYGTSESQGRVGDAVRFKVYGSVVYPGPIEQDLSTHPSIKEISVVSGRTNDWMGDELTFCIQLMDGASEIPEQDILDFCGNDELKVPARIIYMKTLPMTSNCRKVSKKLLRQKVEEMIKEDESVGKTKWFKDMGDEMCF